MLKPIPGFPGYEISPSGEVFSRISNKFLSTKNITRGYPYITLRIGEGRRTNVPLHRLLALTYLPNEKNLPEVNHIDGNKLNYSLNNLEWVSPSSNIRHAFETGLARYTPCIPYKEIPEIIKKLRTEEITWSDLAREFGVSDSGTIRKLIKREFQRNGKEDEFSQLVSLVRLRAQNAKKTPVEITSPEGTTSIVESLHAAAKALGISSPATVYKALKKTRPIKGYTIRRLHA